MANILMFTMVNHILPVLPREFVRLEPRATA